MINNSTVRLLSDTLAVSKMMSQISNSAEAVKKASQNLTQYIIETQHAKHKKGED